MSYCNETVLPEWELHCLPHQIHSPLPSRLHNGQLKSVVNFLWVMTRASCLWLTLDIMDKSQAYIFGAPLVLWGRIKAVGGQGYKSRATFRNHSVTGQGRPPFPTSPKWNSGPDWLAPSQVFRVCPTGCRMVHILIWVCVGASGVTPFPSAVLATQWIRSGGVGVRPRRSSWLLAAGDRLSRREPCPGQVVWLRHSRAVPRCVAGSRSRPCWNAAVLLVGSDGMLTVRQTDNSVHNVAVQPSGFWIGAGCVSVPGCSQPPCA